MNNLHELNDRIMRRMRGGEATIGCFLVSGSSFMAEAMAHHPLDWMVIDMEASHASREDLLHLLQALGAYDVAPIVRIGDHSKHEVELSLDLGARGIVVPKVDSVVQAEKITRACFYPPKGDRGVNCIRASGYYTRAAEYFARANETILSVVQIESAEGVEHCHGIAQLPTVDVLFVGPGDLAASYGQNGVVTGPKMDGARQRVVEACRKADKIAGIFAHSVEAANRYIEEGFRFVALGNEVKFVSAGLTLCLKSIRRRGAAGGPP